MQTIVINNEKGGVGKTFISAHIAWHLAELGKSVLFIDLDGQGNSSTVLRAARQGGWSFDLFEKGAMQKLIPEPGITLLAGQRRLSSIDKPTEAEAFIEQFRDIAGDFDYCVFDTPPSWGWRNFAAMAVCDHLLAPVELKDFAISGVGHLLQSMKNVQQKGRDGRPINFLGLLVSKYNSHSRREKDNLQTLLNEFGTRMMFPGVVTTRDGYEQAMSDAVPVWKIKTSGAAVAGREIRAILATLHDRISEPVAAETQAEAV